MFKPALLLSCAVALVSTSSPSPRTITQQPVEKIVVDVRLQQLVATVRDESGKIVKGLHKEDFIVEDDGTPQEIVHFSDDPDAPVSIGILVDATGSMERMPGGAESGIAAAAGITRVLLHHLKSDDEVALMTFNDSFAVKQDFTTSHAKLEEALAGLQFNGGMNVLRAIAPALREVHKARYPKRALIVMTDAYFSGDLKRVASAIHEAEVPIFTFAVRGVDFGPTVHYCITACHQFETLPPLQNLTHQPGFPNHDPFPNHTQPFLETLANESGGRSTVFELDPRNTMQRINSAIDDIAADLRGQYLLGYYPAKSTSGGIRVRTTTPSHRVHIRREAQLLPKP